MFFIYYMNHFIFICSYIWWIDGLYSDKKRASYSKRILWMNVELLLCFWGSFFVTKKREEEERTIYGQYIYICEICAHPHLSSRMAKEGALLFVFASPFFPLRSRSFLSLLGSSVLLCPFLLISLPPSPFLGCSDVLI